MVEVSILNINVNNITSSGSLNIGKTLIIRSEDKKKINKNTNDDSKKNTE